MRLPSPTAKQLAQRLIEREVSIEAASFTYIFEKLRAVLISLVGVAGFEVLLARSFALAKMEVAWLGKVPTKAEGTLSRLQEAALLQSPEPLEKGYVELLTQFLGLLITFIGEDLTVQIIQDAWRDELPLPQNLDTEETSE